MRRIAYRAGYKYQMAEHYEIELGFAPIVDVHTEWCTFVALPNGRGRLRISAGYAWDGPSGPAFDTDDFMRASLVHDALYQLMRIGLLNSEIYRPKADGAMYQICREDRMSYFRALYCWRAVRGGAAFAARPESQKPILYSPKGAAA